jgi:hypothetical protein
MAGSVLLANGRVLLAAIEPVVPAAVMRAADGFYAPEMDLVRAVVILLACTALWLAVVLTTRPEADDVLDRFYRRVHPGGWWGRVAARTGVTSADPPAGRLWPGFLLGALFFYASLLGVGYVLTGRAGLGALLLAVSAGAGAMTVRIAHADTPPAAGRPAR